MAPVNPQAPVTDNSRPLLRREVAFDGHWRDGATPEGLIVESWSEGFMVGALIIMACITVANMRQGVLLHKLILLELCLAMAHGTFCFMDFNGYGWYLSSTATLLYCSYFLHNVVAWMKIRPFFIGRGSFFRPRTGKIVQVVYLTTLLMTIPPLILQIFDNFRFFNNINDLYRSVRPYEPFMRDPWWISTNIVLLHVIRKSYGASVFHLIRQSPRLGILLCAVCFAIVFTIMDILSSIIGKLSTTDGINPYWKLSLVFKCLTDTIMLDDFKTELRKLGHARMEKDEDLRRKSNALVASRKEDSYSFSGPRRHEIEDVYLNPLGLDGPLRGPEDGFTHAHMAPRRGTGEKPTNPEDMSLADFLTAGEDQIAPAKTPAGPRRQSSSARAAFGKIGTKISKLPSLGEQNKDPWIVTKEGSGSLCEEGSESQSSKSD